MLTHRHASSIVDGACRPFAHDWGMIDSLPPAESAHIHGRWGRRANQAVGNGAQWPGHGAKLCRLGLDDSEKPFCPVLLASITTGYGIKRNYRLVMGIFGHAKPKYRRYCVSML